MKKQAILLTAYKNFDYLYCLTAELVKNFDVYVHIDKKAKERKAVINKLQAMGCYACSSYSINWGSFNHVRAVIKLLEKSSVNGYSYYHIITGEDIPAKPISYFNDFFNDNDKIYIEYVKNSEWETRYKWYYPFRNINPRSRIYYQVLSPLSLGIQKKLRVNRKKIGEYDEIYKGLFYSSLPHNAVTYTLDYIRKNKKFMRSLALTFIPEEFFFQTILLNSPLHDKVANDCLRYAVWGEKNGSFPGYLDDKDIQPILDSNCVFARKVNYTYSSNLVDTLFDVYTEKEK